MKSWGSPGALCALPEEFHLLSPSGGRLNHSCFLHVDVCFDSAYIYHTQRYVLNFHRRNLCGSKPMRALSFLCSFYSLLFLVYLYILF